jgi:hypothetical protein
MIYDLVQEDGGSKLVVHCKDDETKAAIDLTGSTVFLDFRSNQGQQASRPMVIRTPATAGIVECLFAAEELKAGTLKFQVRIVDNLNRPLTQLEPVALYVRSKQL